MEIGNDNLALQHVDDVRVVPDGLSREGFSANDDTVHCIAAQQVPHDERTLVVTVATESVIESRRTTIVALQLRRHRVRVDRKYRAGVVAEDVVDDHRLGAAGEDRARGIGSASVTPCRCGAADAIPILFKDAVGHAQLCLMSFNHVEAGEVAVGRNDISAEGDQCTVNAGGRIRSQIDTAPQAHTRSATGADLIGTQAVVVVRIERPAGTVAIVQTRSDDDLATGYSFSYQLGAHADFNPRTFELQDHVRVNHEAGVKSGAIAACEGQIKNPGERRSVIRERGGRGVQVRDQCVVATTGVVRTVQTT